MLINHKITLNWATILFKPCYCKLVLISKHLIPYVQYTVGLVLSHQQYESLFLHPCNHTKFSISHLVGQSLYCNLHVCCVSVACLPGCLCSCSVPGSGTHHRNRKRHRIRASSLLEGGEEGWTRLWYGVCSIIVFKCCGTVGPFMRKLF